MFNPSLFSKEQIYNTLHYILHNNFEYFNLLLARWFKKKNLLETNISLEKLVKVLKLHLDKSSVPLLVKEFPILKGETIKSLLLTKDNFSFAKASYLFADSNLKYLKKGEETDFSPLNFAYKRENFDSILTMLGMWNEDKIHLEYREFKETLINLMNKKQDFSKAQKKYKEG